MKFSENIIPFDELKTFGKLRFVTGREIMGYDEGAGASTGQVEEVRVELSSSAQRKNFEVKLPPSVKIADFKRGDIVKLIDLEIKNYAVIEADAFGNQANEGFSKRAKGLEKVAGTPKQTPNSTEKKVSDRQ